MATWADSPPIDRSSLARLGPKAGIKDRLVSPDVKSDSKARLDSNFESSDYKLGSSKARYNPTRTVVADKGKKKIMGSSRRQQFIVV